MKRYRNHFVGLPFYTVYYRCLSFFVALCRPSLDRPFTVTIQNITETIHEHYIELGIVLNDDDLFWTVRLNEGKEGLW